MPATLIELLARHPGGLAALLFGFGALIGSFLNVVIHRLPKMMEQSWRHECQTLLELPASAPPARFDLLWPNSHCPHCQANIKPWHNIPLLSYLWLRGRCAHCQGHIALRYPLVELVTALLSVATFMLLWDGSHLGPPVAALLLTWTLIALTVIDLDHQLLPDSLTLPLLWLGLLFNQASLFTAPADALYGAVAGYLSLWSFYWLFKLATGKEGMGHGDFKLLALLGAWLGWRLLPLIIILSSLLGALIGIALIALRGHDRQVPIPFGPFLAGAGWIALIWGETLTRGYLAYLGIG